MIGKCFQLSAVVLVALLIPPMLARAGYRAPLVLSAMMAEITVVGDGVSDTLSASVGFISSSTSAMAQQMINANALAGHMLEHAGASTATIADSIGNAMTGAVDAVQSFFSGLFSGSPSGSSTGAITATPQSTLQAVSLAPTRPQLLAAIQDLFRQVLPPDILAQLRGSKGDPGPAGIQGPSGYSIGAVYPTTNNQNAGTIGGVTYFGAKEVTTQTLTATGASTLASLNVSGATTLSSLAVSGTTTLANFTVSALDVAGNGSVSGTFEAGTLKGDGQQLTLAHIGASTFSTVQHLQDTFHSTGWVSGGDITNNGSGNVMVATGTGLIRNANNALATLAFFDWPASGSFDLTDNANNYIYIDYNNGNPKVTLLAAEDTTNYQSRFLLANIVRTGSELYFNEMVRPTVGDHAALMIRQMQKVMPYSNESGGDIMAGTNPLVFDIMAGTWWNGLIRFTTPVFDGDADTFTYFYRNGLGGWTEVDGSTQINDTKFDNSSGTLATLTDNHYGIHWVYLYTNGDVSVVYGSRSYTLNEAQNAEEPVDLPVQVKNTAFIAGKIIIRKGATSLTQINSVAMMQKRFPAGTIADHNSLIGLQGGTTDAYYHLTVAQHDRWASGSASLGLMADCSNGTASKLLYNPTTGAFSCGVDQNTGGGGGGSLQIREYRVGGFVSVPATASFDPGKFNLTASGSSDVTISLDWTNGPASRSANETITGNWIFGGANLGLLVNNNASISGNFEITGSLQAGRTILSGSASVSATLEATTLKGGGPRV